MQANVNDVVIHYELEGGGDAPFVTMSHSLATTLDLFDLQVSVLRGGYRILRFDTRGHGGSSTPPGPWTIEMMAADVIALLDYRLHATFDCPRSIDQDRGSGLALAV